MEGKRRKREEIERGVEGVEGEREGESGGD